MKRKWQDNHFFAFKWSINLLLFANAVIFITVNFNLECDTRKQNVVIILVIVFAIVNLLGAIIGLLKLIFTKEQS